MAQGVNTLGEARPQMAHGWGFPARCGRDGGAGRARCGQRLVHAAEKSDPVVFLRRNRHDLGLLVLV